MRPFQSCSNLVVFLALFVSSEGLSQSSSFLGTKPFGIGDRSSGLGLSRDYNPAIGANILVGGAYLSKDLQSLSWPEGLGYDTGLLFQEAEVGLAAAVDPYFRGDLVIALHLHDGEFHTEVEEGYVTTLSLPYVTLRAGKFYLPFGRHNVLHTHAFPFIDAPLPNLAILGHHGLNEMAFEAAVLLPLPWFVEFSAYAANGDDEVLFASKKGRDLAYGGRLHTLLDLSDSVTLQIGGSYAGGRDKNANWSHIYGADLTLKWIPLGRERYNRLIWQSEFIGFSRTGGKVAMPGQEQAADNSANPEPKPLLISGTGGFYSFLAAQVAQQWWLEGRFDATGYPKGEKLHRASGLLAFVPTEFSALRLQYSYTREGRVHQVLLQLNVTFGAHPAHAY